MENTHVLRHTVITEKAHALEEGKVYTCMVAKEATKIDITKAIEKYYGVKVAKVRVVHVRGKSRLVGKGRTITKRADGKKALIFLKKGEKAIDFLKLKK